MSRRAPTIATLLAPTTTPRSSSSRSRPSWPACTRRRCASTTGSGWSRPSRTRGGGRRYSGRDVALLREVQRLSQEEGVSLAGHPAHPRAREPGDRPARPGARAVATSSSAARRQRGVARPRVFAVGPTGDVIAVRAGQRPPAAAARRRSSSGARLLPLTVRPRRRPAGAPWPAARGSPRSAARAAGRRRARG